MNLNFVARQDDQIAITLLDLIQELNSPGVETAVISNGEFIDQDQILLETADETRGGILISGSIYIGFAYGDLKAASPSNGDRCCCVVIEKRNGKLRKETRCRKAVLESMIRTVWEIKGEKPWFWDPSIPIPPPEPKKKIGRNMTDW